MDLFVYACVMYNIMSRIVLCCFWPFIQRFSKKKQDLWWAKDEEVLPERKVKGAGEGSLIPQREYCLNNQCRQRIRIKQKRIWRITTNSDTAENQREPLIVAEMGQEWAHIYTSEQDPIANWHCRTKVRTLNSIMGRERKHRNLFDMNAECRYVRESVKSSKEPASSSDCRENRTSKMPYKMR